MSGRVAWGGVGFLVAAVLLATPAGPLELITLQVREARRVPEGRDVLFVYEVQNGPVDRVRIDGAELELRDRQGQRIDILRLSSPGLVRRDEAAFLRGRVEAALVKEAAEIRLVLRAQLDFRVPVHDAARPPQILEYRFPGGEGPAAPRQRPAALRLRLAGLITSRERPDLLILYALRNEGPTDLTRVLLDLRYEGEGVLLEAQRLPVGGGVLPAGQEAFVEAWLSRPKARRVDRVVARAILSTPTGAPVQVIPLELEGGEPGEPGANVGRPGREANPGKAWRRIRWSPTAFDREPGRS